jgi:hypothetical protein
MTQEKKDAPDWERIEADYRAGILSLREIAAAHPGSNHVAITRKAKAEGWTRDLSAKIKAKADELVTKRTVTADVTAKSPVSEREIIDSGAETIARVRLAHRTDIARSRKLAMSLLTELEVTSGNIELFEELGIFLRDEDEKGQDKRNDLYNKVISMSGRVSNMKSLADTLKTLVGLEREAYGIAEAQKLELTGAGGGAVQIIATSLDESL